jgi:hypothetical protein
MPKEDDIFGDSVGIYIACFVVQALASYYNFWLGVLVAIGIWAYTILSLIKEIRDVGGAESMNDFTRALIVLVVDAFLLWVFQQV